MEADVVVWLIFIIVWLVSSVAQALKKVASNRPGQAPGPEHPAGRSPASEQAPPQPTAPPEGLRDLMRRMGMEIEVVDEAPVPSEHRPTMSEHRPTASERRPTASEHRPTASEQRPTASETRRTVSEHRRTAGEHRGTASEHRRGDVVLPPVPLSAPAKVSHLGSPIARAVRRDLTRGKRTLAEILALREVLGPPVGERPYDGGGF